MVQLANAEWSAGIEHWQSRERIVLLPEVQLILTRAACRWAEVPLAEGEAQERCEQLAAMIDGAGGVATRHWHARRARKAAESWAAGLVQRVREGSLEVAEKQPLAVVASHTEPDGRLLELELAAVELLNLLRPSSRCRASSSMRRWSYWLIRNGASGCRKATNCSSPLLRKFADSMPSSLSPQRG